MIFRRRRKDDEIPADEAEDTTETDPSAGSTDDTEPEAETDEVGGVADDGEAADDGELDVDALDFATGAVPDPGT